MECAAKRDLFSCDATRSVKYPYLTAHCSRVTLFQVETPAGCGKNDFPQPAPSLYRTSRSFMFSFTLRLRAAALLRLVAGYGGAGSVTYSARAATADNTYPQDRDSDALSPLPWGLGKCVVRAAQPRISRSRNFASSARLPSKRPAGSAALSPDFHFPSQLPIW